jgi:hypothetical protein
MTEAIINLQALLVKSYHHSKAFPIGYHGAQVLRPASRYSARLNAVRRDCLLWVISGPSRCGMGMSGLPESRRSFPYVGATGFRQLRTFVALCRRAQSQQKSKQMLS